MRYKLLYLFLLFLAISGRSFCQRTDDSLHKNQTWPFRIATGVSIGYPEIPFINIGAKVQDKYCIDIYIGIRTEKKSPGYFNFGYQLTNFLNQKINLQAGPCIMIVKNSAADDLITTFGIHFKITKVFHNRIGVFVSGNAGLPDKRTTYSNQINGNIGIEYYFKRVPLLFY